MIMPVGDLQDSSTIGSKASMKKVDLPLDPCLETFDIFRFESDSKSGL